VVSVLGFLETSSDWTAMKAVSYYRTYLPLREVHRNAPDITATVLSRPMIVGRSDEELAGYDLYMMSRIYGEFPGDFANAVHQAGGKWIFDTDDDLSENSRMLLGYGHQFKVALRMADHVTVSTPALAEALAQYCQRPPVVLRNHVDCEWFASVAGQMRRVLSGVTVGLSGSSSHYWDWKVATEALGRLAADYQDVTPVLHGFEPFYAECLERVAKFEHVPYAVYPAILGQLDVVLCAVDTEDMFNSYRSDVKALEAMAVGAVPVCSSQAEYGQLWIAGAPILLVEEETADCWYETIRPLVEDESLRADLSARGREWVRNHRDMVDGYRDWAEAYRRFLD
jgi:glycosyltransferase involved in cell wall biosynthesis